LVPVANPPLPSLNRMRTIPVAHPTSAMSSPLTAVEIRHADLVRARGAGVVGSREEGVVARVQEDADFRDVLRGNREVELAVTVEVRGGDRFGRQAGGVVDRSLKRAVAVSEHHAHRVRTGIRRDQVERSVAVQVDRREAVRVDAGRVAHRRREREGGKRGMW
jgi:hypothetical protein